MAWGQAACSGEGRWQQLLSTLSDPPKAETLTPVLSKCSWKSSSCTQAPLETLLLPYKHRSLFCSCVVPVRNLNQKVQNKSCWKTRGDGTAAPCLNHLLAVAGAGFFTILNTFYSVWLGRFLCSHVLGSCCFEIIMGIKEWCGLEKHLLWNSWEL